MSETATVWKILLDAMDELKGSEAWGKPLEPGQDIDLYGANATLDSMQLVTLVVAVEQAVEDQLGCTLNLADERAMSAQRSPFRSTVSLVALVEERLAELKV